MDRPKGNRLAAILDSQAAAAPGHAAILYRDRSINYRDLRAQSIAAAKSLMHFGIGRGDRVGVLLGNQPEWVIMALATSYLGATLVPLNTWYKETELRWTLRHCGLRLLVSAAHFLKADYLALLGKIVPEAAGAAPGEIASPEFPALKSLFFTGGAPAGTPDWESFLRAGEAVPGAEFVAAAARATGEDAAFILYTSGSTAEPKGVLLNGAGVVGNGFELGRRRDIQAEDRVWCGTPLFYGLGATNAFPATLTRGATMVLQDYFDAGSAIELVRRTEASVYYGTGNMTRAMLDHPDYAQRKIGSLQKGNAGTVAEYKRLTLIEMGIRGAVPAYGLTETYGNATVGWPDDPLEAKLETSGTPLPGMEMRIVDPQTGRDLPKGEVGLVLIRGHTTPGYLRNPEETARALRPDGFFDTGDLGRFDPDGRFIFHSRLKEIIKSGGINVSPVEVEQLIASHPDIRDAYVVGIADPVRGELVVAFVDAVARLGESEVQAYVKERAASFKVPHHVLFRSETQLPRLASGKIARHRLQEEARRELGV
jgi:fatty-acyl-CoA synthase